MDHLKKQFLSVAVAAVSLIGSPEEAQAQSKLGASIHRRPELKEPILRVENNSPGKDYYVETTRPVADVTRIGQDGNLPGFWVPAGTDLDVLMSGFGNTAFFQPVATQEKDALEGTSFVLNYIGGDSTVTILEAAATNGIAKSIVMVPYTLSDSVLTTNGAEALAEPITIQPGVTFSFYLQADPTAQSGRAPFVAWTLGGYAQAVENDGGQQAPTIELTDKGIEVKDPNTPAIGERLTVVVAEEDGQDANGNGVPSEGWTIVGSQAQVNEYLATIGLSGPFTIAVRDIGDNVATATFDVTGKLTEQGNEVPQGLKAALSNRYYGRSGFRSAPNPQ